jgi:hypothetical protein
MRVQEDLVLIGAHTRNQLVYGEWSLDLGEFLTGRREMKWKVRLKHNFWLKVHRTHARPPKQIRRPALQPNGNSSLTHAEQ